MEKDTQSAQISRELARNLLQIKAIRLNPQNPFRWASGISSPIYCDNRLVLSYPLVRDLVQQGLVRAAGKWSFDAVVGVATAGIPHGVLLAERLRKPFAYVRSKRKGHGRQNLLEGHLEPRQRVLVVEDLVSTGGSCLKAVENLREAGCEVVGALALFTYGFPKAEAAFKAADCPLQTLSDYPTLLDVAVEQGFLEKDTLSLLSQWREDPENWNV